VAKQYVDKTQLLQELLPWWLLLTVAHLCTVFGYSIVCISKHFTSLRIYFGLMSYCIHEKEPNEYVLKYNKNIDKQALKTMHILPYIQHHSLPLATMAQIKTQSSITLKISESETLATVGLLNFASLKTKQILETTKNY